MADGDRMMIDLQPLAPRDFEAWLPLWQGYLTFYKAQLPEPVTRLTFERLTGGSEPMGAFIARDEGGVALGIVHWILHRSCWTAGDYCYLQDLFVMPGRRNGGIGRKLIAAVYAEAARHDCSRVYWLTHETNHDAMKLYDQVADRSGFLQYRKVL
ncbi:MAG: GNAT family N-acetyltransferase [Proteobacteria bacterium]|nr:GNAT family N-acetyltransferase [Pseudomonadota bacterium]